MSAQDNGNAIAIIGMSLRVPGARSRIELWNNLKNGVESITFFSDETLRAAGIDDTTLADPNYVKAASLTADIDLFDASFFGLNPREVEVMDPQHRIFLECCWEALESAGYDPATSSGLIGTFAGAGGIETYYLHHIHPNIALRKSMGYQLYLSNLSDFIATRTAYILNLRGPCISIQTACSTSLVAIDLACQNLLNFQCDIALAGSASFHFPQTSGYFYREGMIFSPDGHCRPFDAGGNGTIGGNGAGVVLLKRLNDALADGDFIYAIIRGSATNNDGANKIGYTAPSIDGQSSVISHTIAIADISPETIEMVEAHGTGTPLGDPIEIAALTKAFSAGTKKKQFCAIGSVKSNVGHLDTAAGVIGLIKTALSLHHAQIPPSLHFTEPNPQIDFENSPFFVNTSLRDWPSGENPRRAGVSSFGMGGTNAHAILEEAPAQTPSGPSRPWQVIFLSAKSRSALDSMTANLIEHLNSNPEQNFADVVYTLHVGRRIFNHRRMLVCQDHADAAIAFTTLGTRRVFTDEQEETNRPVVFMFSGQGSQYVNMGRELYQCEPVFKAELDDCASALMAANGIDIRKILYPPDSDIDRASEQIKQTSITQPALFAVEYALAKLWMSWGVQPAALIGHSIGEYVAACIAGVLTVGDALALVAARGQLMQTMPTGSMLAVSAAEKDVQPFLPPDCTLAANNAPSLCVFAGPTPSIESLQDDLETEGIECQRLHTSHAFHSSMMDPILDPFTKLVEHVPLQVPEIPFISNVTGTWITEAQATSPSYWAEHLRNPVLFSQGVQQLMKDPKRIFIEIGPGRTLTTFAKQHSKSSKLVALSSLRHPYEQQSDVGFILNTLGRMWLAGFQVNWFGFYAHEQRRRVPLPTYPFERQRYWIEPPSHPLGAASLEARTERTTPDTWLYAPCWKQVLLPHSKKHLGLSAAHCLVFADHLGFGDKLARDLKQHGFGVTIAHMGTSFLRIDENNYQIDPRNPEDYAMLLNELAAHNHVPKTIAHLWGVTPTEDFRPPPERLHEMLGAGFVSLTLLAQAIGKQRIGEPIHISIITTGMQRVSEWDLPCPEKATVLGPGKVIPKEYQNLFCRSIDIHLPERGTAEEAQLVQELGREIFSERPEPIVAYRGGSRWVQSFEPIQLDFSNSKKDWLPSNGGVCLITGGLGGIGLAVAEHLASKAHYTFILVSRTALPARHEWPALLAERADTEISPTLHRQQQKIRRIISIEKQGSTVMIANASVADARQMQDLLHRIYIQFDKIDMLIHAAGEPAGGMIQRKSVSRAESNLSAKVHGTLILDYLLHNRPPKMILYFSSLASVLGVFGQSDYCAANAFLDAFAMHKAARSAGSRFVSINWDGWQEIGMAAESAQKHIDHSGPQQQSAAVAGASGGVMKSVSDYLSPPEGLAILDLILNSHMPQIIVSKQELRQRIEQSLAKKALTASKDSTDDSGARSTYSRMEDSIPKSIHPRPHLATDFVAARNPTEQNIADTWQKLLGIERVGIHDNFFELGGDSLMAVQVIAKLREITKVDLPAHSLLSAPTIAEITDLLTRADAPSSISYSRRRLPRSLPSTLVKIKSGSSAHPLFLVHPVGGHVYLYRDFAAYSKPELTIFGIQAQGIDGKSKPLTSVEEMAALYLEAIQSIQPKGPYYLGGASFGGVIAYEIAQHFDRIGESIALLTMFDSPSPGYMPVRKFERDADILAYLLGVGDDLPVPSMRIQKLSPDDQLLYFIKQSGIAKRMLPELALTQMRHFLHLFNVNSQAMLEYKPKPYRGHIVFFRASEPDGYNATNPERGWIELVLGGLTLYEAPGNHITMNFKPNVEFIAERIQAYIDKGTQGAPAA